MNKRARIRLIAVTGIVLAAVASIVVFLVLFAADKSTVADIADNPDLVGDRVKVTGSVVAGSWDKKTNPMRFDIRDEGADDNAPTVQVVFTGEMPSTFGDGVIAIVTGTISETGVVESDNMITKCPSKYEAADDALSVASILSARASMIGITTKLTGDIVSGSVNDPASAVRFAIAGEGSEAIDVAFSGGLPEGVTDGATVVLQGALEEDGVFVATSVSLAGAAQ